LRNGGSAQRDGSFAQWLRARHDHDLFEKEIADRVEEWFGD